MKPSGFAFLMQKLGIVNKTQKVQIFQFCGKSLFQSTIRSEPPHAALPHAVLCLVRAACSVGCHPSHSGHDRNPRMGAFPLSSTGFESSPFIPHLLTLSLSPHIHNTPLVEPVMQLFHVALKQNTSCPCSQIKCRRCRSRGCLGAVQLLCEAGLLSSCLCRPPLQTLLLLIDVVVSLGGLGAALSVAGGNTPFYHAAPAPQSLILEPCWV